MFLGGTNPLANHCRRCCLLQALYTLDYQTKIKPAWGLLKQCMQSEPGCAGGQRCSCCCCYAYPLGWPAVCVSACLTAPRWQMTLAATAFDWLTPSACCCARCRQEPQGGHVCVKDPSKFLDPLKMRRPSREQQQR